MLTITDERDDNEIRLHEVEVSGLFIWNEILFRRLDLTSGITISYDGDNIPVVLQRTGAVTLIDRNAWVIPCECEMMIVG